MNGMIEASQRLRERNLAIVWLRPGEKRPTRMGWTLKGQEASDYVPGSNLGIMTGRLSGDLVCVDLDGEQALAQADTFLPMTDMIDGRPGKPRAHRWYRVTDVPEEMTSRAAGGIGGPWLKHFQGARIDFLGTGGQAMVPPSVHPESGETRLWDSDGEPTVVDCAELWNAVCALAKASGWEERASKEVDGSDERVERCRAYLATVDPAISGQGGHDATFRAAKIIVNDFGVGEQEAAMSLLREYNARCQPPWTEAELAHKLADAVATNDASHPKDEKFASGQAPPEVRRAYHASAKDLLTRWRDDVWTGKAPVMYRIGPGALGRIEVGPGLVTLVGGAPGAGKTAFAMQAVTDALRITPELRCAIVNVEMAPSALLDRVLARLSGVPLTAIRRRQLTAEHTDRIDLAMNTMDQFADRLTFVERPFDLSNVMATCREVGAGLVVIDYVQRLEPLPGKHASKRDAVNSVMDELRRLAESGLAVFVVAAVARTKDRKGRSSYAGDGLNLASFRESSELEFGADDAFLLVPEDESCVILRHLKARHSEPRDLALTFDRATQRFYEFAAQDRKVG